MIDKLIDWLFDKGLGIVCLPSWRKIPSTSTRTRKPTELLQTSHSGTVLYCTFRYCTVLYCTVLYCTVLYCTVLYCTVLYCTVLYCTVLYCTWDYGMILYFFYYSKYQFTSVVNAFNLYVPLIWTKNYWAYICIIYRCMS